MRIWAGSCASGRRIRVRGRKDGSEGALRYSCGGPGVVGGAVFRAKGDHVQTGEEDKCKLSLERTAYTANDQGPYSSVHVSRGALGIQTAQSG